MGDFAKQYATLLLVLALAGAACVSSAAPPSETPSTTVATLRQDATTTDPPPPTTEPAVGEGALDVAPLVAFVEEARNRTFDTIPGITVLAADFVPTGGPDPVGELDWALLRVLGLATPSERAAAEALYEQRLLEGGFGYCCPVVARERSEADATEAIIVHELVHLIDRVPINMGGTIEERAFATAVGEGNAVRVEEQFLATRGRTLAEIRDEYDGLPADAPKPVIDLIQFPYVEGYQLSLAIAEAGGEAAIDAAILAGPLSAEQVMFPEAFLSGEAPIKVDIPKTPEDASLLRFGTIGSFLLKLVIEEQIGSEAAIDLVRQWAGDSYKLFRSEDQVCVIADIAMDDGESAATLADALETSLNPLTVQAVEHTVHLEQCQTEPAP